MIALYLFDFDIAAVHRSMIVGTLPGRRFHFLCIEFFYLKNYSLQKVQGAGYSIFFLLDTSSYFI